MSTKLKIRVEENKDSIYLFDMTGKHAKPCNEGGWGNLNQNISLATSAEFQIYPPNVTTPIIINVFPDFPTMDSLGYEVLPADLGMNKLTSGIWRFDFFVRTFSSAGETHYSASCQKLFTKDVKCCLDKSAIKATIENFESKEVVKSNNLHGLFVSAEDNACLGLTKEAQKIIDYLYTKCKCNC